MRKRALTIAMALAMLAGAGWVAAETPAPAPKSGTMMGGGPMGGGMMGHGMGMGTMMGGGMCPLMMGGPETQVAVKNVDKGVTITLTSSDPAAVKRIQKMAEAMRLMHEAMAQ